MSLIGQSVARREDQRLVTGYGCFVDDVRLPTAMQVVFVRSMVASGQITNVDLTAARAMPGVVGVFSGADVAHIGELNVNAMLDQSSTLPVEVLAHERVLAVGQPVCAVVATSLWQALDAANEVQVDIDETPAHAPMFSHLPDDQVMAGEYLQGDCVAAFEAADVTVRASIRHPRLVPSPMENRAIAVSCDTPGHLTIWLGSQTPHRAREGLARMIGIDQNQLHVIAPDVGGAFGLKASLYPEEVFVVWAAHHLRRSIRWSASRGEDMLAATHGRGLATTGELALTKDGSFLALRADVVAPLGHWLPTSAGVPAWNAARILPGPYLIPTVAISARAIASNTAAVGIYRGAGRPEAAALMEALVDQAAIVLKLDRLDIRRQNLLRPDQLPYTGPTGARLDSGDFLQGLSRVQELADYGALVREIDRRRNGGECVGLGVAIYVEPCGLGWESASIRQLPDGQIVAATGGSSQGHGRETALAQIVADELQVPIESVTIRQGDTNDCPTGIGALASRSTAIGASAMQQLAGEYKARLDADSDGAAMSLRYEAPGEAWGFGCYLAVVSIDTDTGSATTEQIFCVDDAGRQINPAMVAGQILGGIAQGLGEALLERVVYDEDGQLLTGSLMDYNLPRAVDMPAVTLASICTESAANTLGAKGVGEAGTIGAPAAIAGAVRDALRAHGVGGAHEIDMPFTSEKLWRALHQQKTNSVGKQP